MRACLVIGFLALIALPACRTAPTAQSREQQLKDSFLQQIASTPIVRDFRREGDTVSFTARHGERPDAKWRVHIDSATIDRPADAAAQEKGVVKSTWSVDGEEIRPRGSQSDLPLPFLDNGLAQECWAFWESGNHQWSWK